MNTLSLLFVTVVVGTFMTFGETMWNNSRGSSSRVVDQCAVDPSSVSVFDRIRQTGNIALLETGLEDMKKALAQNDNTVKRDIKANKDNVLNRLGELLENDHLEDAIKLKVARILRLSCVLDCDHLIESNLSELLIRQLNKNSNSVDIKEEILLVLNSAAQKRAEACDTLVDQGIIESVTTLVNEHNERPKSQYVLHVAAFLIRSILSIKELDSEKTHSLVPVLSKLLKYPHLGKGQGLVSMMFEPRPQILPQEPHSFRKVDLALDAVVNLLTKETCIKVFNDRKLRCKLISSLEKILNHPLCRLRSLGSLEKLFGFTPDPQETELKPRLERIKDAILNEMKWCKAQKIQKA